MTVLDGEEQAVFEADRIFDVKAVLRMLTCVIGVGLEVVAEIRGREGLFESVIVPCAAEIIFCPCAVECGRPRLAIDEKHVVALAPPARIRKIDVDMAAYIVTTAFGFEDYIVVFSSGIEPLLAGYAIWGMYFGGIFSSPLSVEASNVTIELVIRFIVNVEVIGSGAICFIEDFKASATSEWHREPAVEAAIKHL